VAVEAEGLTALEARLRRDLDLLCYPPPEWRPAQAAAQDHDLDVVVVGAGMCGLTAAFALMRRGIGRLQLLDARPAGREGPWVTYARMHTLRSPKHLTGPALGLPSLTFRAWFEAQWGAEAWSALGRIPRTRWMDYLRWYRHVLGLPVRNQAPVRRIEPLCKQGQPRGFLLYLNAAHGLEQLCARKVVLATGREGLARPRIPAAFQGHLGHGCQHSSEEIDFTRLAGRRVAVIGLAASALDNAAEALEAGAAQVHVLGRSRAMPRVNKAKGIVYAGFTEGFPALDDAHKLEIMEYIAGCGIPAPRDTVQRVAHHRALRLHMGCEVSRVERTGQALTLRVPTGPIEVDHVILGTGFRIDVHAAPELAHFAARIARWRDRHVAHPEHAGSEYLDFPYLGPGFEFLPREPGSADYLRDLHCFSHAASLSHGNVSSDIPAVSEGADRLAGAIARDLFVADQAAHRRRLEEFEDPELLGDELPIEQWWPPVERG
jgi:cation diffusion facilitator CzcD-associated flavoprotein CzcO